MDNDNTNASSEDLSDSTPQSPPFPSQQRLYFVPLRWWKDAEDSATVESDGNRAVLYTAVPGSSSYGGPMKIINNIFNSDVLFNLRREEQSTPNGENSEVGISGRDYALVLGDMWLKALKRHSDTKVAAKGRSFSAAEDDMSDVYPLQLRLSLLREVDLLGVKISKKDNATELYRRACKIFSFDTEMLRIWDFSGESNLFSLKEKDKLPTDCQWQLDQEILLELQVYGLSDNINCREGRKDNGFLQFSNGKSSSGSAFMMNCSSGQSGINSFRCNSLFFGKSGEAGSLGLTGLQNLGNTCFMNSAIQCLAHTPKLVDYFLGDYDREINHHNPLGMDGEIALAFGDLLRKLWTPGATPVAPRTFKSKLGRFAPQFSGFNQHDSQELLAFLLDGLHEDLNRVKSKPYVEAKDGEGRSDEDIADEYWQNHTARNDSIIVDVCQGQYKSTLVCPVCRKVSVTFDPFMYLSLPLPSTNTRTMTLTVVSSDGNFPPTPYTISVPKSGKCEDLIQALGVACSLGVDETLLVAEVYNNRIIRYLEDLTDSLSLIRDGDRLVAYRLKKDENAPLVVFIHQHMEEHHVHGKPTSSWKAFGIPLVGRISNLVNGSNIRTLYENLLSPFLSRGNDIVDSSENAGSTATEEATGTEDACSCKSRENGNLLNVGVDSSSAAAPVFYLTNEKGTTKEFEIAADEPFSMPESPTRFNVLACWPEKQIEVYDMQLLNSLPEILKSGFLAKRPQETVSLYKCLEAFLKEEPLGPEDMWFCPSCKMHRQASKKLDLWRLPDVLVIHLKRFSYTRFMKNKLETYVDFPVDDLDLSTYISYKNGHLAHRYVLYAISNHYGSMGGGHYTAFVNHGGDRWYDFDDSQVHPIGQDTIKTSAAYVLFYRRVIET